MSKRALGKGLDALFTAGAEETRTAEQPAASDTAAEGQIYHIAIDKIKANPDQPRKTFDNATLQELAQSIKEKGVLQPVLLQKLRDDYLLVAGERRFRAAGLAGLEKVPAIVVSYSEEERLEIALIENLQREDLLPIDEALAYEGLIKTTGYSQDELAKKLGKKRSTIANSLRLLRLPPSIQQALQEKLITSGHARAILSVKESRQEDFFKTIVAKGLSVRMAEEAAAKLEDEGPGKKKETKRREKVPAELREMEQKLLDIFGTKIAVKGNLEGGKIEITYYSMDDLNRIYEIVEQLSNK